MFASRIGVCALFPLVLWGCAAGTPSKAVKDAPETMPTPSGFLAGISDLQPSPEEPGRWYSLSRRITSYKTFIVDTPLLLTTKTTRGVAINPTEADELCVALQHELSQSLSWKYDLTTIPGPGVARVRTAITAIAGTLPPDGGSPQAGGGTREMEIVDSQTGDRLAAVIESDYGRDEHVDAPRAEFHDTRATFSHWAARLMLMLQNAEALATTD